MTHRLHWQRDGITLWCGDALETLRALPSESVHCVVTSPPYWGLRDYGVDGQIGLEESPDEHIARLVEVFREVRRVLRADGTAWVNYGDAYAGSWGAQSRGDCQDGYTDGKSMGRARQIAAHPKRTLTGSAKRTPGLKPKDLIGLPWMLAFALRADGWWLRSEVIWHKPSPMPESAKDRPSTSHEHLFLLTKAATYYFDEEAIKEPCSSSFDADDVARAFNRRRATADRQDNSPEGCHTPGATTRKKRTVWTISSEPCPAAHFATFPTGLVEPCILAGTSERGCCPECGAPHQRILQRGPEVGDWNKADTRDEKVNRNKNGQKTWDGYQPPATLGWQPTCDCDAGEPVPCVVLDPFAGSGTTGMVAERLLRRAVLIELSPDYCEIARQRCGAQRNLFMAADPAGGVA